MSLAEEYRFSDFTFEVYEQMVKQAVDYYQPLFYNELEEADTSQPFILWRHDLDHSIDNALKMARIEAKHGLKATYFIHPHNEFYNFMELDIYQKLKEIEGLGHQLALHFDVHFHGIATIDKLEQALQWEKSLIENVFDCEVQVFSFHNNNEFTLSSREWRYGGMINTYATRFQEEIAYCSDSNGYWRYERLPELIETKKYDHFQVLTHPVLWEEQAISPRARIQKCADENKDRVMKIYDDHLIEFGRPNIGKDE